MASEHDILLDETLRPSPPLAPHVLRNILIAVALINLAFVAYFVSQGAWPIAPFMGLDVALLAWAFRASTRAAQREERVTLTASELCIARDAPRAPHREWRFNPYWVRVEMDAEPDHWSQLTLWSHGKFLRIGQFLAPEERARFGAVLKRALSIARTTLPPSP
jgi:uncharacterized membrane protein